MADEFKRATRISHWMFSDWRGRYERLSSKDRRFARRAARRTLRKQLTYEV